MSLLKKVAKVAVKVAKPLAQSYVNTAFPVAAPFISSAINAAKSSTGSQPVSLMPSSNDGGLVTVAGSRAAPGKGPSMLGMAGNAITNVGKGIGNMLIAGGNVAMNQAGRVLGVIRGGKLFGNAKVLKLAKQVGMDAASIALGVGVADLAAMIINAQESAGRKARRGRGISGRDVHVTRRTLNKIRSIEHSLAGSCRPRARSRTRSAPAQFVRQG
jgi:hypothetical protein